MNKVSVLLALYNPNITFLIKQLISLENQNYPNLELIIMDDCSNPEIQIEINKAIETYLNKLPYKLILSPQNLGSNKVFEKLTELSTGDYLAYCDQDDIWESDKITKLLERLREQNALVCYSDLSIINETDELVAPSFKDISKRLNHVWGASQYGYFLRRNSITGCTMLIDSSLAKRSLPFPLYDEYVHDHWLALNASCNGNVAYIEEPLVRYRIHTNNQIGAKVLNGIETKEDYLCNKLLKERKKVELVKNRNISKGNELIDKEIFIFEKFVNKRIAFFESNSFKNLLSFFSVFKYDPTLIIFEFLICNLPYSVSKQLIKRAKR